MKQTRTRNKKQAPYMYYVKNMESPGDNHRICGLNLHWNDMFHPNESNYLGLEGLAPDLSDGVVGKQGLYHLSCLCAAHAQVWDSVFIKKLKKALPNVAVPASPDAIVDVVATTKSPGGVNAAKPIPNGKKRTYSDSSGNESSSSSSSDSDSGGGSDGPLSQELV